MRAGKEVHWHEGLFLQPHHLQMLQRNLAEQVGVERRLSWAYPYGLVEAHVSEDELQNMRVHFQSLTAVMPSGIRVEVPGNAELPALDIREAFKAKPGTLTIYLGVPLWYQDRANSIDPQDESGDWWRVKCLYQVQETEVVDENTGTNPRPMLVRKVNARLLLEDSDRSDMEVLPVLQIRRTTGEEGGLPTSDESYIPPCMVIKGASALYEMVKDLTNQIEASRTEMVNLLMRGSYQVDTIRGIQVEQIVRLKTLSRFSARLPALIEVPGVAPFDVFMELGELMAELASLQPDTDPFDMPKYNHDDPAPSFQALCDTIRPMLMGKSAASFMKEAFIYEDDNRAWATQLSDDDLALANEFYLGVKTRQDPVAVAKLVEDPDRFKLMPKSIVTKRVRGIALKEDRHPPIQLPAETGLNYFRLDREANPAIWEQIGREKEVGVTWVGVAASDFQLTLFMTVPEVQK